MKRHADAGKGFSQFFWCNPGITVIGVSVVAVKRKAVRGYEIPVTSFVATVCGTHIISRNCGFKVFTGLDCVLCIISAVFWIFSAGCREKRKWRFQSFNNIHFYHFFLVLFI
ncbi:MAG: hypothetical protein IKH13_09130 [Clostridia bacterium]|nr:hypothetical protein [Clostridia bacterium]